MFGGFGGYGIAPASKRTTRLSIKSSASRGFSSPLPLIAVLASLMSGSKDLSCSAGLSGVGGIGSARIVLFQPFTRTSLTIHETPNRTPAPPIHGTQDDWMSAVNACGNVDAPTRLSKTAIMPTTTISVLTSQCRRRLSFISNDNAAVSVWRNHRSLWQHRLHDPVRLVCTLDRPRSRSGYIVCLRATRPRPKFGPESG